MEDIESKIIKRVFEYLDMQSEGMSMYVWSVDWDVVEKLTTHWIKTGEDHLDDYTTLLCYLIQVDFELYNKRVDISEEIMLILGRLFGGQYVFDINDFPEEIKLLKEIYDKRTSPEYIKKERRIRACRVVSLKRVRVAVFERDGNKCVYCGSQNDLTVDHKIPINQGGLDEFDNFQTLCRKCNSSKSDRIILNQPAEISINNTCKPRI